MSYEYQCLNCKKLGNCQETDEEKCRAMYCCELWEPASEEVVLARNDVISRYGNQGLLSILKTESKES